MEIDKRVESLESEFKLMRGELKQTLTSVRDHLLNLKLPPSQEAALLAAAIGGQGGGMSMDGRFSIERGDESERSERSERSGRGERGTDILEPPPETNEMPGEEAAEGDESLEPEAELSEQPEDPDEPLEDDAIGDDAVGDETTMESIETGRQLCQDTPPVNLLANLIRWVSSAKREIGSEQLATFLEVYGISGHLSPELKEVILHLADITAAEAADASAAEIWSQLTLELHGILTGGDTPLHTLRPYWNNGDGEAKPGEAEEDKPKHKPSKLKLVLSGGDGEDREFSLDLKSDEE